LGIYFILVGFPGKNATTVDDTGTATRILFVSLFIHPHFVYSLSTFACSAIKMSRGQFLVNQDFSGARCTSSGACDLRPVDFQCTRYYHLIKKDVGRKLEKPVARARAWAAVPPRGAIKSKPPLFKTRRKNEYFTINFKYKYLSFTFIYSIKFHSVFL
jgi:hypothetical protein